MIPKRGAKSTRVSTNCCHVSEILQLFNFWRGVDNTVVSLNDLELNEIWQY